MGSLPSSRWGQLSLLLNLLLLLTASQSVSAGGNNKNRPTAFCKLPGWPGHPAPHCDPALEKDCCPGTTCLADPNLAGTFTCQDSHRGQHGRKADNANPTIDDGSKKSSASNSLFHYLAESHSQLLAAERALMLASKSAEKSKKGKSSDGKSSQQNGGGFDWHQYAPPSQGGSSGEKGQKGSSSKSSGGQQQGGGGFDYNKYIPGGSGQESSGGDAHKSSDKGSKPHISAVLQANAPVVHGQESATESRAPTSKFATLPPSLVDRAASNSKEARERAQVDLDAILRVTAQALLDAQSQLKTSGELARLVVLSEIKAVLESTLTSVDGAMGSSRETASLRTGTPSPTAVSDFNWRQYVPSDVKDKADFSTGDRRPGSLDGPCGKTDSKDFGTCDGNNLRCVGGDQSAPGTCKAKSSSAYARTKAQEAAQQTTNAVQILEDAQVELRAKATLMLLESEQILQNVGPEDEDSGEDAAASDSKEAAMTPSGNGTTTIDKALADLSHVSTSSIVVFLVGALVLGFFLWSRTQQRRRAYRQIEVERGQEP